MNSSVSGRGNVRFGPFEFDAARRELRRHGELVNLQDQPLRMLSILVEHAGELVTREEFQRHLWPNGTFVEFDHSLNTAVRKLRHALGDRPESPLFVETVPRRGYRFIARLEPAGAGDFPAPPLPPASPSKRPLKLVIAVAIFFVVAIGFAQVWREPRLRPSRNGLLLNFRRLTADSGLSWQPAISRDGNLIAFSSDRAEEGNLDLWVMQVNGNNPVRLTNDSSDDLEPDFCPDGRIVFRSDRREGGVYIVPALGGTPVLLSSKGRNPRCSPDGKWVAFWIGRDYGFWESSVYVVSTAGGEPHRVGLQLARCLLPLWSADSSKLLVFGYPDKATPWNRAEWYLIPIATGTPKMLNIRAALAPDLNFPIGAPLPLAWVARTGEVLFSASQGQEDYPTTRANLWSVTLRADTGAIAGGVKQLTTSTGLHTAPSVADDGTIVFSDLDLNPDVWGVQIDHRSAALIGEPQPVTRDKYWESRPNVSADESTFVFRTDRGGGWDFWSLDLRTNKSRPITISRESKVYPALSRDGSTIAWNSGRAVYTAELRTGVIRRLCTDCDAVPSDWTKDGNIVVSLPERHAIAIMRSNDGSMQEIVGSTVTNLAGVAISPDDRWITFVSGLDEVDTSNDGKLMIAPIDAFPVPRGAWIQIAPAAGIPRWSPDSRRVYFVSKADGWACIWAVELDHKTGKPLGSPAPVMHFHRRRYPLLGSYAISEKRLFVGLHETTGNIWAARQEEKSR